VDERSLIEAARGGSEVAFARLVEKHQERLLRFLARYCGDETEAEDIAQEVFLKAYVKITGFQAESGFYTWLYRIAVNTASDVMKRRRRRQTLSLEREELGPGLQSDPISGPLASAKRREESEVVREVLAGLPDRYRAVLVLREFEGFSYQEMARTLRCSIGTIESRLFRARERFRDELERGHPGFRGGE
jgi:RNA polymerase sigma-70 factor (ECF subfamily)